MKRATWLSFSLAGLRFTPIHHIQTTSAIICYIRLWQHIACQTSCPRPSHTIQHEKTHGAVQGRPPCAPVRRCVRICSDMDNGWVELQQCSTTVWVRNGIRGPVKLIRGQQCVVGYVHVMQVASGITTHGRADFCYLCMGPVQDDYAFAVHPKHKRAKHSSLPWRAVQHQGEHAFCSMCGTYKMMLMLHGAGLVSTITLLGPHAAWHCDSVNILAADTARVGATDCFS